MAKAIYDVSVPNIYEVEKALGDAKDKAPRAMKNAVNQTATRAKNMMIRQAKLRYAVSTAGRRHLNQLKTPKTAQRYRIRPQKFSSKVEETIWRISRQTQPNHTWAETGYTRLNFIQARF